MKRPRFNFGDLLAGWSRTKIPAPSSSRIPATNETDDQIQKQLADAREEAQNALAEWRRYPTPYYTHATFAEKSNHSVTLRQHRPRNVASFRVNKGESRLVLTRDLFFGGETPGGNSRLDDSSRETVGV